MLYLLDANVLIAAHDEYYPLDRVPQFWEWLAARAQAGETKMPFEIYGEVSDGPLKEWMTDGAIRPHLLLEEEADQDIVAQVLNDGYGPNLTDSELEKIGQDPFLISYALAATDRTVVTKETSKPSATRGNRKVPDVCDDVGVKWMRDFDLYKTLNFTTR